MQVLVCDGVTDVMTPAMIGAKILQYNRKPKAASGGLIQEAYEIERLAVENQQY